MPNMLKREQPLPRDKGLVNAQHEIAAQPDVQAHHAAQIDGPWCGVDGGDQAPHVWVA
jgi:hypothetical protein